MTLTVSENQGDELLELEANSCLYFISCKRYPVGSAGPFSIKQTIRDKTPQIEKASTKTRNTINTANFVGFFSFLSAFL